MQEITTREKLFALLGFFILLFSLPLALLVVRQRVTYRGRATGVVSVPKQVMVTNVHSKGFTVSWLTDNQTNGSVFNGTSEVQDVRGVADTYYTHYVDVLNLTPETDYLIKIKSGPDTYGYTSLNEGTWDKGLNTAKTVRTAKQIGDETQDPSPTNPYGAYSTEEGAFGPCPNGTLDASGNPNMNAHCFRPYPIYGEVKNSSGQAVNGALVYAAIKETSISSLYLISAISGSDGKWSLELANQYTNNFQSYLAYTPSSDRIFVVAYNNNSLAVAQQLAMASVLSTDCPDQNTNCPMNAPSPVILILSGGATPPPTTTPIPTATPVVTNPPGGGISFVINKVQLQGRTDGTMSYVVKFRQANSANTSAVLGIANVTTNSSGVGNGSVNLSAGSYDVYLVPSESYLSAKLTNVSFSSASTTLDFSNGAMINGESVCNNTLCAGDVKNLPSSNADQVDLYDYQATVGKFDQNRSSLSDVLKQTDFNNSGKVDLYDYTFVSGNFDKKGADRQ